MKRLPVQVVKIGGSLLDLADLSERVEKWLAIQAPAHHVLLVGGGALVDQIRHWHAIQPLDDVEAHWMCVDLMVITAKLFGTKFPSAKLIEDFGQLRDRIEEAGVTIFVTGNWLRQGEPNMPGTKLPMNWDVSSDSVAARLAIGLGTQELVLLKSTLPGLDERAGIEALGASGYVDPMLPQLAPELPSIRLVNFRETPFQERVVPR